MIRFSVKSIVAIATAVVGLSTAAQARQPYVDITSDIAVTSNLGSLQPVALGEDFTLSPCGSNVTTTSASPIDSICNTVHPDEWSINYLISFGGTTSALTFGTGGDGVAASVATLVGSEGGTVQSLGNAAAGLGPVSFSTGVGTLFSTVGTYVISLITAVDDDAILTGLNGRPGQDGGLVISDSGLTVNGATVGNFDGTTIGTLGVVSGGNPSDGNGRRNVAFSQATLVVTEAITVPEPSAYLLLLMALGMMTWQQRRQQTRVIRKVRKNA